MMNFDDEFEKLLSLPLAELMKIRDQTKSEEEALRNRVSQSQSRYLALLEKSKCLNDDLDDIKANRENIEKFLCNLKDNEDKIAEKYQNLHQKTGSIKSVFDEIKTENKLIYDLYQSKQAEITELKNNIKDEVDQAKMKNKEAFNALSLKKESLEATKQVLESKLACLNHDRDERIKMENVLNDLKDSNYENKLKELRSEEENLNQELSQLNLKYDELKKVIADLDSQNKSMNSNAESLTLSLAEGSKNNEELRIINRYDGELFLKSFTEKATKEAQKVHEDNLRLATNLRDLLIKNEQMVEEVKLKNEKCAASEKQCHDLSTILSDKKDLIRKVEAEIEGNIKRKDRLLKKSDNIKEKRNKKEMNIEEIKKKIEDKKSILKRLEKEAKSTKLIEKMEELSSGGSCFSFSMTSITGTLPDISDILADISTSTITTNDNDIRFHE